jgi:hypothetical protein
MHERSIEHPYSECLLMVANSECPPRAILSAPKPPESPALGLVDQLALYVPLTA